MSFKIELNYDREICKKCISNHMNSKFNSAREQGSSLGFDYRRFIWEIEDKPICHSAFDEEITISCPIGKISVNVNDPIPDTCPYKLEHILKEPK